MLGPAGRVQAAPNLYPGDRFGGICTARVARRPVEPRRALAAAAVLSLMLGAAILVGLVGGRSSPLARRGSAHERLLGLPVAAQGPVSGALGADDPALKALIQQGKKLTGGGEIDQGGFGASVALSADGDTALIGGPGDDGVGAVWVFTRTGSTWTQQGPKLTGGGEIGNGEFGRSVALSANGDTALIGGRGDDGDVGAAWVFTRSGSTWTQQGPKLTGSGEIGDGDFGVSVALSANGDTALIGGSADDETTGAAWVFTRSGGVWSQQGEKLTGGGGCGTPFFGRSVALSANGNTALIGGPVDCDVGAAWVFTRTGTTWSQQGAKLTGGGEIGKGWFGERVALSANGDTALIGAWFDDKATGAAWVFTRAGASWSPQGGKLTASGGLGTRFFGHSVALSSDGDTALIGGTYGDTGFPGAAWVFTRAGSSWTQREERLVGSGESVEGYFGSAGGDFGESAALSSDGETALIGGASDNQLVGAAWVFVNQPTVASNPAEYGRCLRVPRASGELSRGQYENARCTEMGRKQADEWYPGVARTNFTSGTTEGSATIETVKGARVTCSAETGTGEYTGTGTTTVGGVVLTFTGCEWLGEKCSTAGAAEGEVATTRLQGTLGITELGETNLENRIGLALSPAESGSMMEFSCGAVPVSVRGSVIVPVRANQMLLAPKLNFSAVRGRQTPESFVGAPREVLEASFEHEPFEQAGLRVKTTQTNEEAIEVSSIF
jgi:FG-GAP repeat